MNLQQFIDQEREAERKAEPVPGAYAELLLERLQTLVDGQPVKQEDFQQKALDAGFKYWRASDAHGITGTKEQAEAFIRDIVGVEVQIIESIPGADCAAQEVQSSAVVGRHLPFPEYLKGG